MIQIEVEPFVPFIKDCPQYVERVADITTIVKESNSRQQVVVSDNAETGSLQRAAKHADVLGLSIFRSRKGTDGQVFTYNWLSTNMYKVKLAWSKVSQQKMLISALQGEPWFTSINMIYTPLQEQEKTMTVSILNDQLNIASQLVTSRVYIDGVEWWYFMKVNNGIDVYWNLIMKMLLRQGD